MQQTAISTAVTLTGRNKHVRAKHSKRDSCVSFPILFLSLFSDVERGMRKTPMLGGRKEKECEGKETEERQQNKTKTLGDAGCHGRVYVL